MIIDTTCGMEERSDSPPGRDPRTEEEQEKSANPPRGPQASKWRGVNKKKKTSRSPHPPPTHNDVTHMWM